MRARAMNSTEKILIASSSFDEATWGPIASAIEARGYETVIFEADKVALGSTTFEISLSNHDGLEVYYAGNRFCLDAIQAAWYRRTSFIADTAQDASQQLAIDSERKAAQMAMWASITDAKWLNSPENIQRANRKISQLDRAQSIGFTIPTTVVANEWRAINDALPEKIIYKSSYPLLYEAREVRSLFTTAFDNDPTKLPQARNPFPGIWQNHLDKAREWRITVVGDDFFDAAIYTADDAKDDWRKHQNTQSKVTFRHEAFPDDVKEKCLTYLDSYNLRFGAFDFVESYDGEITFLECNPNGQFMWIEHELGLPISDAITSTLIRIAKEN